MEVIVFADFFILSSSFVIPRLIARTMRQISMHWNLSCTTSRRCVGEYEGNGNIRTSSDLIVREIYGESRCESCSYDGSCSTEVSLAAAAMMSGLVLNDRERLPQGQSLGFDEHCLTRRPLPMHI